MFNVYPRGPILYMYSIYLQTPPEYFLSIDPYLKDVNITIWLAVANV